MKKTKNKRKTSSRKINWRRPAHYPSYYLAICLVLLLIIEFTAFSATTSADWKKGLAVVDMSQGFSQTFKDVTETLQPMIDIGADINRFYEIAAEETVKLFENESYNDTVSIFTGVNEFYAQASRQMEIVLDVSGTNFWPSQVAGASLEVNSP